VASEPRRRAGPRHAGKGKPPVLGLIQRGGQVVLRMLANVQQTTIKPVITAAVAPGTLVHTDEYSIYARLPAWGYQHKTVCHGRGEYVRDEDGDGFCEVHVNTIEGFWSLLRSWLRPHRGISQDKLPLYLGFFQLVHNARRRGKAPARYPHRYPRQMIQANTPEPDKSRPGMHQRPSKPDHDVSILRRRVGQAPATPPKLASLLRSPRRSHNQKAKKCCLSWYAGTNERS